jgi:dCTP deaminase
MMLSDEMIVTYIRDGFIGIDPFDENRVQAASYDLTLSNKFKDFSFYKVVNGEAVSLADIPLDPSDKETFFYSPTVELTSYVLDSGEFILGCTNEKIKLSSAVAGRVEGKSSIGRIGLFVHSTAGFIDPGFEGYITLEFFNGSPRPIILRPGMAIAQLAFQTLSSPAKRPYGRERGSHYTDQLRPEPIESRVDKQIKGI